MRQSIATDARRLFDLTWKGLLVGIVAGLGAVGFRALLAVVHGLAFTGRWSPSYDANLHTPEAPWGVGVIAVPVLGAMAVAFLVTRFAPEAKGHGVPEVMKAIYYDKGVIRPVVSIVKALASAISIGTGGAVGREGPIAQIGASFGSSLAQWLRLPTWQRVTLLAAGAGAGIAATFNTPIGGVLFAMELMLVEVSARTVLTVAVATTAATLIGRAFFGVHPSFVVPAMDASLPWVFGPSLFALYVAFGALVGAAAALYTRSIYFFEDAFERMPGGYYVRHGAGMLLVGVTMFVLMRTTGEYWVEGVGYATVQDLLNGTLVVPALLVVLFFAKLLATSLTLGSGASGGIFSPALFLGAVMGQLFGVVASGLFPELGVSPLAFTVVGMAAMVGGATGAMMTAVTMVFEMTRDYNVVVPMILTVAAAHAVRKALLTDSIYTLKLTRRGLALPDTMGAELTLAQAVTRLADTHVARVEPSTHIADALVSFPDAHCFVIATGPAEEEIVGVATRGEALEALAHGDPPTVSDIARPFVWLDAHGRLREAFGAMREAKVAVGLVRTGGGNVAAMDRGALLRALDLAIELVELEP